MEPKDKRNPETFVIHTSQEMEALERAAADGKYGRNYDITPYPQALVHTVPGHIHQVRLELTPEEEEAGLTLDMLTELARQQDADAALAILCIAHQLAPPAPLPPRDYAGGEVHLDDVIEKIGWTPRSSEERRAMHKRIYQFILFGERAQVIGARAGTYVDKHTNQVIDTEVSAPLWRIHEREKPTQGSLFPEAAVPLKLELVISRTWATLLTSPQTAQYLPMGEVLGAIPGGKPSGAWARVIGLALASFWRRNPTETVAGELLPTRRELLERYPPKTGPAEEVVFGENPAFALKYWCQALQILAKSGFIEEEGEVTKSPADHLKELPRYQWGSQWLAGTADIRPGAMMRQAVSSRATALQQARPRRRGRPRKSPG